MWECFTIPIEVQETRTTICHGFCDALDGSRADHAENEGDRQLIGGSCSCNLSLGMHQCLYTNRCQEYRCGILLSENGGLNLRFKCWFVGENNRLASMEREEVSLIIRGLLESIVMWIRELASNLHYFPSSKRLQVSSICSKRTSIPSNVANSFGVFC